MPLKSGNTPAAISANVSDLVDEGYPHEQALAIALHKANTGEDHVTPLRGGVSGKRVDSGNKKTSGTSMGVRG